MKRKTQNNKRERNGEIIERSKRKEEDERVKEEVNSEKIESRSGERARRRRRTKNRSSQRKKYYQTTQMQERKVPSKLFSFRKAVFPRKYTPRRLSPPRYVGRGK